MRSMKQAEALRKKYFHYEHTVAGLINEKNPSIKAICHEREDYSPDIYIYDNKNNLLGYVEVQVSDFHKPDGGYRYDDFKFYERRRVKDYGLKPCMFFLYDKNYGNHYLWKMKTLLNFEPLKFGWLRRDGKVEVFSHLPLKGFGKNKISDIHKVFI